MILLTSSGLSSPKLIKALTPYVNKGERAALVTTAAVGSKEKSGDVPLLVAELEQLGVSVDFFDFDRDSAKKLLTYDLVEMIGGNPFYLLKAIQSRKAEKMMEEIAAKKVLIGVSGGALVMQKNLDLIYQFLPSMNKKPALMDFTALGLVEIETFPHFSKFAAQQAHFKQRVEEYEERTKSKVFLLEDGQGVLIDNKMVRVIL